MVEQEIEADNSIRDYESKIPYNSTDIYYTIGTKAREALFLVRAGNPMADRVALQIVLPVRLFVTGFLLPARRARRILRLQG